jgi:hypothetical protein
MKSSILPSRPVRAAICKMRADAPAMTYQAIGTHFGVSVLTVHKVLLDQSRNGALDS